MKERSVNLKKLVLAGLMMALVTLATSVIKIPTTNGYIHLGDGFIFISAIVLGPFYGAFAAGVGSMLADILGGFPLWAPYTLVIKAAMALFMGLILRKKTKQQSYIAAGVVVMIWSAFFITIKNALQKAIQFSAENLAAALEDTAVNVMQRAEALQWILTAAILVFLAMVLLLMLWLAKRQKAAGFSPAVALGMMTAGACMIIGYYFAEYLIYGNPISPVFSVPMNLVQFIGGIVVASAVAPALAKLKVVEE